MRSEQHQADEGLAQANTIAKEAPCEAVGDLDEVLVRILLVLGQDRETSGIAAVPLVRG